MVELTLNLSGINLRFTVDDTVADLLPFAEHLTQFPHCQMFGEHQDHTVEVTVWSDGEHDIAELEINLEAITKRFYNAPCEANTTWHNKEIIYLRKEEEKC